MKTIIFPILTAVALAISSPSSAMEPQQATNWCWAASIQDVLDEAGVAQSQSQIASRLTGWSYNRPASAGEVAMILRSYGFRAQQAGRPGSPAELALALQSGWKLIAFVRPTNGPVGHFIVLEGILPNGAVVVSDPANGSTTAQAPMALHYAWRWSDTIVVGTPQDQASRRPSAHAQDGDSCVHANDGACDEPSLCDPGTDTTDCKGRSSDDEEESASSSAQADDSCEYANDGTCDEPSVCARGTDATDCGHAAPRARHRSRPTDRPARTARSQTYTPAPPATMTPYCCDATGRPWCAMSVASPAGSACGCAGIAGSGFVCLRR